ncbi:hypothetical protein E0H62_33680 [Rhizobium leguminosarum bv. viciae]|nr:hypothetical protein E0H62_33680 [Rhizobium leguminosarum bv. viciae]
MLDKTRPSRPNFETAFKRWWDGQPASYRNRIDASAAQRGPMSSRNRLAGCVSRGNYFRLNRFRI